jgi:3-isopropylmalate dehydratase
VSRKNFTNAESFISEPDSRAQCLALEDNVKEFGLTYFGMTDRRQGTQIWYPTGHANISLGIVHIIGPEQGFTVRAMIYFFYYIQLKMLF